VSTLALEAERHVCLSKAHEMSAKYKFSMHNKNVTNLI